MQQDSGPSTEHLSRPKRRWKVMKWGAILVAIALVVGVLLWVALLLGASRQLRLARAEAREAGLAVSPAELLADLERVPDELDIGPDVLEAAALIDEDSPQYEAFWNFRANYESDNPADERAAFLLVERDYVNANRAAIERAAAMDPKIPPATDAARMNIDDWLATKSLLDAGEKPVMLDVMLPTLNSGRNVAEVLRSDAHAALHDGDGARAIRSWLRILAMAQALETSGYSLVESLVAVGYRAVAANGVRVAAREKPAVLAAAPAELRAALHAQLRSYDGEAAWRRAMEGELVFGQDALDSVADGRGSGEMVGWSPMAMALGGPLLRGDQAQLARWTADLAAAADAKTWPEFKDRIVPVEEAFDMGGFRDIFASMLAPSLENAAEANFRCRLELAAADVALAIAEYAADHDGNFPPTLDALVPTYLPAVPRDPFAADAPLKYDAARALLWSAGRNAVDDGGSNALPLGLRRRDDWDRLDRLYPLTLDAFDRAEADEE